MNRTTLQTERKRDISPNVMTPPRPKTLTTGERCMGWLLVVWPVAGALAVSTQAAWIMPQLGVWDYVVWLLPLVFTVAVTLLSSVLPGYVGAWALCALGDTAERYGAPRRVVWPVVVLLCALLGSWLLGSVSGSWQKAAPGAVHTSFALVVVASLWWLLRGRRVLISNAKVLRAFYVATVFINIGFAVSALLQRGSGGLSTDYVFAQNRAGWAAMYNPLLPRGTFGMSEYSNPEQDPELNAGFLHALLGCPPPEGTHIRGRIGYANTELLLFTTAPEKAFEQWLQTAFPECEWQEAPRYLAFYIMGQEFLPADYRACRYTRLPDAGGAQRYLIHNLGHGEYIYLRFPGIRAVELQPKQFLKPQPPFTPTLNYSPA